MNRFDPCVVVQVERGAEGVAGLTDEELALEMQRGGAAAMEALVHRYHRQVHAYLYRLTGDGPVADDLAQEAFIRVCTRIDTYRYPDPFRAWLYAIAHNAFKDYARSAWRRRVVTGAGPPPEPQPAEPSPLDMLVRQAERQAVVRAVADLPELHRHAVLLRFYHGLKISEIAAAIGVPEGTVKSRLSHAIDRLRASLGLPAKGGRARETRGV